MFVFFLLFCRSFWIRISVFWFLYVLQICSVTVACHFTLYMMSFNENKFLILVPSILSALSYMISALYIPKQRLKNICLSKVLKIIYIYLQNILIFHHLHLYLWSTWSWFFCIWIVVKIHFFCYGIYYNAIYYKYHPFELLCRVTLIINPGSLYICLRILYCAPRVNCLSLQKCQKILIIVAFKP